MTVFEAISVALGVITIIITLIGCTWHLSWKLSSFVTHQVCKERMSQHEKSIDEIKSILQKRR